MQESEGDKRRDEEIEALQAIYCDGVLEVDRMGAGGVALTFRLPLDDDPAVVLRVRVFLPATYPTTSVPECEAACDAFSRSQHCHLSSLVNTTCQAPELVGRECVFDILQRICEVAQHLHLEGGGAERGGDQEHGTGRTDRNEQAQEEMDELCCLQLDHMRDEKTYIKTIRSWARDLGLHGRLLLQGRFIFILLQGRRKLISNYIALQRTQQVDVDSSGRKCKERMLDVVSRIPRAEPLYSDFQVVRLETRKDLFDVLHAADLQDVLSFSK